jgi:glycosyltransferase involved in cell wall biosynthesis
LTAVVSVITPCYNVERYLAQTVHSMLGQTFADWEHILVDDGSTDGTGALADELAALDPRIRVIHQPNAGAPAARVTGYAAADPRSRYALWLDGDDILEPNMLEVMLSYLEAHPQVGTLLANRQHMDEMGTPIMVGWRPTRLAPGTFLPVELEDSEPETPFATLFAQDSVSSPSATVVRRSVYDASPGWDATFGQPFEDWDLVFQLALLAEVHYIPNVLTRYRLGRPGQSTTTNHERGLRLYHKLYERWSCYEGVPREKLATVGDAIRFREGRVLPFQHLTWGTQHLRQREWKAAAFSFLRSARFLGRYVVKNLKGTYRNRLLQAGGA